MDFNSLFEKAATFAETQYRNYKRLGGPQDLLIKFKKGISLGELSVDEKTVISRLPIDLIFFRKNLQHCIFLIVNSSPKIDKDFQRIIHFCQYYLTLFIDPYKFHLILAAQDKSDIDKVPYYSGTDEKNNDFYVDNGIGLWFAKPNDMTILHNPKDLRELTKLAFFDKSRSTDAINKLVKFLNQQKISLSEDIVKNALTDCWPEINRFFDTYIHHAVKASARSPIYLEARHLNSSLLREVCKTNSLCYCNDLNKMISEHLSEKGDEFAFCRRVCSTLWQDHLNVPYSKVFETWDRVLREIFSDYGYRDHFLHEFQVFLMGTYILDKIKPELEKIGLPYKDIGKTWLLASTFHDFAYPVQKYNDFSKKFFKEFLKVDNLAPLELKSHVVEDSLLSCLGEIICYFLIRHKNKKEIPAHWLYEEKDLVHFFHEKVTKSLNHGVIAGISLLKIAESHNISEEVLRSVFLPAALAISLHHRGWQYIEEPGEIDRKDILKALKLKIDPISFILVFCDAVQEWGRPRNNGVSGKASEKDFELKRFSFENNVFNFTIWNANYTMTQPFWTAKDEELSSLQRFLTPAKAIANFCCRIEDKNEKHIDRHMIGPSPRAAV